MQKWQHIPHGGSICFETNFCLDVDSGECWIFNFSDKNDIQNTTGRTVLHGCSIFSNNHTVKLTFYNNLYLALNFHRCSS